MNQPAKTETRARQVRRHVLALAVVWTLLAVASAAWHVRDREYDAEESARIQARTAFDMDVAYRHWNAMHGGIYVHVTAETQPIPELANDPERDITTPSGKRLTLVNPAHMTRRAYEFLRHGEGVQASIVSAKPLRPENTPDAFEARALAAFNRGQAESSSLEDVNGQECMRLMRPLVTEKSCLKCHASQGYREGDIRGGIGVAAPMQPFRAIQTRALRTLALVHLVIWATALGGLVFGGGRMARAMEEQERAEDLLRQGEHKYRALVEGTNDVVYSLDADGIVDFVGPQILNYDYRERDVRSRSFLDFIYPEDKAAVAAEFAARKQTGKGRPFEFRMVANDGRVIWLLDNSKVKHDAGGNFMGITGALVDITERKRAEAALRESEEKHRVLYASSRDAMVTLEPPDWRFASGNPAAIALFRATDEAEFTSKGPWELSPERQPDGRPSLEKAQEMIAKAVREGTNFFEWTHKRLNGEEFPATVLLTRFEWHGQAMLQATVRDITDRKRAEEALRKSEELQRKILRTAMDGFWVADHDGHIREINDAYCSMSGYSREELLSLRISDFEVNEPTPGDVAQHMERIVLDGRHRFETRHRTKDGRIIDVEVAVTSFDPEGKLVFAFLRDITERKRAEEEIRKLASFPREAPDPVLRIALDLTVLYANDAAAPLLRQWDCKVGGCLPEELWEVTAETLRAGQKVDTEIECEGRVFMLLWVPFVPSGYVNVYGRDITARKRAEEAHKASEAQLKEAQRLAQIGSWTLEVETGALTWSEEMYGIFGWDTKLPAPGLKDLPNRYSPESCLLIERNIKQCVATGEPYQIDLELVRTDGTRRWATARGEAVRDDTGRVVRLLGTLQDITERKRANDALRRSAEEERRFSEQLTALSKLTNELQQAASFDDLCRAAVELGCRKLGFERMGLWFADGKGNLAGSFGVDENGQLRDERGLCRPVLEDSVLATMVAGKLRSMLVPQAQLYGVRPQPVGSGALAIAGLWAGEQFMGYVAADNFLRHEPITPQLCQLLELYAGTLGHLCARKRAEEALRESERKVSEALAFNEKILSNSSIGILTCRESGQCVSANEAAAKIVGTNVAGLLALNFHQLQAWKKFGLYEAALGALRTDKVQEIETPGTTTFGRNVWLNVRYSSFQSGGEKHLLMMMSDITERKKAEAALRESEERYRELILNQGEGLGIVDPEERFTFVNPAGEEIFGVARDSLTGRTLKEFMTPEQYALVLKETQKRRAGEKSTYEFEIVRPDGKTRCLLLTAVPRMDKAGRYLGSFGLFRDITERKRAEAALRESEERYRLLADNAEDFVMMTHADGRRLYISPSYFRITGWTPAEIHATDWRTRVHLEDLPVAERAREANLRGQTTTIEHRSLLKDGSWIWLESRCRPVVGPDGKVAEMVVWAHDITERKRAEQALRLSEEKARRHAEELETLMDVVPAAIYVAHDPQCRFVTGNRVANRLLEAPAGENVSPRPAPGKRDSTRRFLRHGRELKPEELPLEQSVAQGVEVRDVELDILLPSGKPTTLYGNASPLFDGQGKVRGGVAAFMDVTERKRAQQETQGLREELYHVRRVMMMGELTAAIAHESNQPLTAIVSNAQAAQRFLADGKLGDQKLREILSDIAAQGLRTSEVLQRIRNGLKKGKLDLKFLDLNSLVRQVAELLPSEALDKNVEVSFHLAPGLPQVRADRVQLQQVILNLLSNAFEALEAAPFHQRRLAIHTTRVDKDRVRVAFEDTGEGIPPGKLRDIFEPTFTTKSTGMGMGLAICRSIIFAHGGRIWASNNPGGGATVQFIIPIDEGMKYNSLAVTDPPAGVDGTADKRG